MTFWEKLDRTWIRSLIALAYQVMSASKYKSKTFNTFPLKGNSGFILDIKKYDDI